MCEVISSTGCLIDRRSTVRRVLHQALGTSGPGLCGPGSVYLCRVSLEVSGFWRLDCGVGPWQDGAEPWKG